MVYVILMEKITNSLDNMKAAIDLKKSFDTIDHTILLQKLNHCEIVSQLVCRYFTHRKQYVQIK